MANQMQKIVRALEPEQAFGLADLSGKDRWVLIETSLEQLRDAVLGKLRRVEENPHLYADKIQAYQFQLESVRLALMLPAGSVEREAALVQALLNHGDGRLVSSTCGVMASATPGLWHVFGLD